MTDILTAEIVEKGARAAYEARCQPDHAAYQWPNQPNWLKERYTNASRACLSAVLPDIVDACAKVADEWSDEVKGDIPHLSRIEFADTCVQIMMGECARRIRALSPNSINQEGE